MSELVGNFIEYDDALVAEAAFFLRLLDRGVALERVLMLAEEQGHDEEWLARAQAAQASVAHRDAGTHETAELFSAVSDDASLSGGTAAAEFRALVNRSAQLPYRQPTMTNRIAAICGPNVSLQRTTVLHARNTRVVLHAHVVPLMRDFLEIKRALGSSVEQALYRDLDVAGLVDRLVLKRPLMFMNGSDNFLLPTGESGAGRGFDKIGTDAEKAPLLLQDYMSYDEMQLATLLAVSTPTHFINAGGRSNCAELEPLGTYERCGVYLAQVGARFERPGRMEYEHMVVTRKQNRHDRGYGPLDSNYNDSRGSSSRQHESEKSSVTQSGRVVDHNRAWLQLWASFYGLPHLPTYEEAAREGACSTMEEEEAVGGETSSTYTPSRFAPLQNGAFLDLHVYRRRMRIAADTFLADANARGASLQRLVYGHLVGLGLGVWQVSDAQAEVVVEVYAESLHSGNYPWLSDLDFSWFPAYCTQCGGASHGESLEDASGHSVTMHFSRRDPAGLLPPSPSPIPSYQHTAAASSTSESTLSSIASGKKLVVAQYAWDSNSYPGNEYWAGSLAASGDPAAACCSTIPELQNPDVNLSLRATGAKVAQPNGDIVSLTAAVAADSEHVQSKNQEQEPQEIDKKRDRSACSEDVFSDVENTQDVQVLWDYMCLRHDLSACTPPHGSPATVLLCLGSSDLRVATHAATLFEQGLATWLVFSGGVSNSIHSGAKVNGWTLPEADVFAEEALRCGVDPSRILVERESTNTGENIRFSHTLLEARGIAVSSLIVVTKPYLSRRAFATLAKQWYTNIGTSPAAGTSTTFSATATVRTPPVFMSSSSASWSAFLEGSALSPRNVVCALVGEVQRIEHYAAPPFKYQIPLDMPLEVRTAGKRLAEKGFIDNLICEGV